MSLIPAFELGLWNAWLLVIPILMLFFYDMIVATAKELGESEDFELTRKENRLTYAVLLPMVISFVYAVFLPLQLDTTWLPSGLIIYPLEATFTIIAF